ncbi:MAG: hypothetical protein AAGF31_00240 [Planctomycetota bacterium]
MLEGFRLGADVLSQWAVPAAIFVIVIAAWRKGIPAYESFLIGAKEGFGVAISIIPYLVAILFAIKLFLAGGLLNDTKALLANIGGTWVTEESIENLDLLPLALTKPLSGGASRGLLAEIYDDEKHGPDSRLGLTASLMMGSTETTFYVLAVYFGAVQIRRTRHTVPACLIADTVGLVTAVVVGFLLYS